MNRSTAWRILALALVLAAAPAAAGAWVLTLPDTVQVGGDRLTLGRLARGPVPAAVRDLTVLAGGLPGTVVTVERRGLLRQLVSAGLAAGVRFEGPETCRVAFAGSRRNARALEGTLRAALQPLVPGGPAGAPAPWFELEIPDLELPCQAAPTVTVSREAELAPGRNLVRVRAQDGPRGREFPVTVVLHQFGEVGRVRDAVPADTPLDPAHFQWEWRDLSEGAGGLVLSRAAVLGHSSARALAPGDLLRAADLEATPLIRVGEAVELKVVRGQVVATVRAFARQAGCLGQIIPVRNELTGRLVNARVAGPGLVEWRR